MHPDVRAVDLLDPATRVVVRRRDGSAHLDMAMGGRVVARAGDSVTITDIDPRVGFLRRSGRADMVISVPPAPPGSLACVEVIAPDGRCVYRSVLVHAAHLGEVSLVTVPFSDTPGGGIAVGRVRALAPQA